MLLLDANALLALAWPQHEFSLAIHDRLAHGALWATCALTQLSLLRLSATPAVLPGVASLASGRAVLQRLSASPNHRFLEAMPPLLEAGVEFERIQGPGQLTDAYLLALARRHHATLLTFDRRMADLAGPDELEILH